MEQLHILWIKYSAGSAISSKYAKVKQNSQWKAVAYTDI